MEISKPRLWTNNFILICIATFLMGFAFYLLMPTLPFFIEEKFHVGKSVVGAVLSCYVIAALLIRPLSGYLVDSFSRKAIYIFSYVSFISLFSGYLFVSTLFIMIILRIIHGFTWGIITTSGNTISIDVMPSSRRGEGIGYFGLTSTISMALGPLAGIFLLDHFSFNAIFYTALLSGFLGLIAASLIKTSHKPVKIHRSLSFDRFILLKSFPIAVNTILFAIPYGMIVSFAAVYGKEWNVGNTGMFFTYLAVGIGASRIFSGKLIDRGKIHMVSILGLSLLSGSILFFSLCHSSWCYFLSAFLIGTGYGTLFPAFMTLFVNLAHHNQRGTANSTWLTAFDLGLGIGMILAGKIAQISSLATAFGFSSVLIAGGVFYYWQISKRSYELHKVAGDEVLAVRK